MKAHFGVLCGLSAAHSSPVPSPGTFKKYIISLACPTLPPHVGGATSGGVIPSAKEEVEKPLLLGSNILGSTRMADGESGLNAVDKNSRLGFSNVSELVVAENG